MSKVNLQENNNGDKQQYLTLNFLTPSFSAMKSSKLLLAGADVLITAFGFFANFFSMRKTFFFLDLGKLGSAPLPTLSSFLEYFSY